MVVACGGGFTVVVAEDGEVLAFSTGGRYQLGLGTHADQLVLVRVGGREVCDSAIIMVPTGFVHAANVAADGSLYTWGDGRHGRLGQVVAEPQPRPMRLDKALFGGSPVVQVACGYAHTVVLTADSRVRTCCQNPHGQLGHGDTVHKLVLTQVGMEHCKGVRTVMVAAGREHSAAVGEDSSVCTWGMGTSGQLGHTMKTGSCQCS